MRRFSGTPRLRLALALGARGVAIVQREHVERPQPGAADAQRVLAGEIARLSLFVPLGSVGERRQRLLVECGQPPLHRAVFSVRTDKPQRARLEGAHVAGGEQLRVADH